MCTPLFVVLSETLNCITFLIHIALSFSHALVHHAPLGYSSYPLARMRSKGYSNHSVVRGCLSVSFSGGSVSGCSD